MDWGGRCVKLDANKNNYAFSKIHVLCTVFFIQQVVKTTFDEHGLIRCGKGVQENLFWEK